MRLSVSVRDQDVQFLDAYVERQGLPSRSAAVQEAIGQLRAAGLGADYAVAGAEWVESGQADLWEQSVGDGLGN
jgi:Arc/MetJ-type ribon-helix-helix transcriptional regulator